MAKKIMIVRHGEKPDKADSIHGVDPQGEHDKKDLAPKGWQRSGALIRFFNPVNGQFSHPALAKPNAVFAASPEGEAKSARSQYTVQSVADSVGVKINLKHDKGDEKELVKDALSKDGVVLIAWEHKAILDVHLRSAITGKIGSPVTIRHHRFLRDPICHIVLGCIQVQTKGHSGWQARPARRRYTIGSQAERIAKPKLDTGNSLRERGSAQARFASTDTRLQGFPPPVQPALPLQSTIGNRPVQRLVASARLQPKL
ncbi:MAG TPA: hypothetical protein VJ255_08045, partial [Candidatus Acidoferrum sp.]|nr:hypothetical protein [Candidatus Acidoferrum sp.]